MARRKAAQLDEELERLHVAREPYAVYEELDLGEGGYSRAPAHEAKRAVPELIRAKHRRA